jgi:hypothetical protein
VTLGETIRARLVANAAVTALVGGRIFPNVMPEGSTMPAIVYTIVSDVPENSFDGSASSRLKNATVQIDSYARASKGIGAYAGAHQVDDAVVEVVANLQEPGLSATLESARDLFDNETEYHRVSSDFTVWR